MGKRRIAIGLSLCLPLLAAVPAAAENTSAYTRVDLDQCRAIPPAADDPLESAAWWCDGHGGMPVYIAESDLRFFVSYGEGARDEPAARTTLPAFNRIGETIEWRLAPDGRPVATILRFFTASGDGEPEGQVLVVTRIGGSGQVCHVGHIDARLTPDANAAARALADQAATVACLGDAPPQAGPGDGPAVTANTSAYTKVKLDACRAIPPAPDDPLESGAWWCDGHAGIPVYVSEGDLRFFVSYGDTAPDELAAMTTLPAFNHIGETIEWRLDPDGRPLATILRFFTSPGDGAPDGQVLVITKLGGPGQVCHLGYVDALTNPDANALARTVADNGAATFDCGRETALHYGLSGDEVPEKY